MCWKTVHAISRDGGHFVNVRERKEKRKLAEMDELSLSLEEEEIEKGSRRTTGLDRRSVPIFRPNVVDIRR